MEINIRPYDKYVFLEIQDGSTTIDVGLLDVIQAKNLLADLEEAVYDLKRYIERV